MTWSVVTKLVVWKKFTESHLNDEFTSLPIFYLSPHNANIQRVFLLMQAQCTKEDNILNAELLRGLLFLKHNSNRISCAHFHTFQKGSVQLGQKTDLRRSVSGHIRRKMTRGLLTDFTVYTIWTLINFVLNLYIFGKMKLWLYMSASLNFFADISSFYVEPLSPQL